MSCCLQRQMFGVIDVVTLPIAAGDLAETRSCGWIMAKSRSFSVSRIRCAPPIAIALSKHKQIALTMPVHSVAPSTLARIKTSRNCRCSSLLRSSRHRASPSQSLRAPQMTRRVPDRPSRQRSKWVESALRCAEEFAYRCSENSAKHCAPSSASRTALGSAATLCVHCVGGNDHMTIDGELGVAMWYGFLDTQRFVGFGWFSSVQPMVRL